MCFDAAAFSFDAVIDAARRMCRNRVVSEWREIPSKRSSDTCEEHITLTNSCMLISTEVVRERGAKKLRRELLVGFEPPPLFVALLEAHFGHLAAFYHDGCGGRAVGIRSSRLLLAARVGIDRSCIMRHGDAWFPRQIRQMIVAEDHSLILHLGALPVCPL